MKPVLSNLGFVMQIGGMSISTAGGIKILRLAVLMKSIPAVVRSLLFEKDVETRFDKKAYSNRDIAVNTMFILLSIIIVFLGAVALTTGGSSFIDSFFETASAFGTVGLSTGITSLSLAIHLKWVLISLMLIGRIEIIPFLIMFVKESESPVEGHEKLGRKLSRLTHP